ncbi:MAG: NADH-quinone oxidoreductase subunit M [Bacteroidota bacterium]|nr:NADH-quinone oxidoreductase subunit M [Bacteroidota bacterium]MDP4235062.1 NADH-quinone oxidoreductase subunit M [Bacteroidota bacterium]
MGLLTLLILIPLAGAAILHFIKDAKSAKIFTLAIALVAFVVSMIVYIQFDSSKAGFQFQEKLPWITSKTIAISYYLGVDGMSLLLVLLTTFLVVIALIGTWNSTDKKIPGLMALILLLEAGMIGVFCSLDLFLFYIFWELILIPMYFIIGIWGGERRIYAAVKFFIYTLAGSLFMLVAIIWLGLEASKVTGVFTTDFTALQVASSKLSLHVQSYLFWAFAISFAIKVPLFPLHTWLPDAHVEAPTIGSVILAGVLLKMGTYGLIRFNLGLFPQASIDYASVFCILAVISIIYGALVAMVQTDIKKLIAYSSVTHMGFIVLGIFSMTREGLQGAVIQMINHGLSTGMLFMMFGMMYERTHTRAIKDYGGLAKITPHYAVFFAIAMLSSVGLPGLNGFVGEYLTLMGAFQSSVLHSWAYAIFSCTGVIIAAVYLLWMYQRFMMGPVTNEHNRSLRDLSKREIFSLVPLVIFMVWIGIQPMSFMKLSEKGMNAQSDTLLGARQQSGYEIVAPKVIVK